MRIALFHQRDTGPGQFSFDHLRPRLTVEGHHVTVMDELDALGPGLEERCDAVVVVGGDATVEAVTARLAGRPIPLALLPAGPASNLATSVGMKPSVDQLLSVLGHHRERRLDVGLASGPWGQRTFCHAAGVGWLTDIRARHVVPYLLAGPERAVPVMQQYLEAYPSQPVEVHVDGQERSGRYLLVEVLNVPLVGAHVVLSPRADAFDGQLDVALVDEVHRGALDAYLHRRTMGEQHPPPPEVPVCRGRHVQLRTGAGRIRVGDEVLELEGPATVDLTVRSGAIRLWVPPAA